MKSNISNGIDWWMNPIIPVIKKANKKLFRLKKGTHFWGKYRGELAIFIKDNKYSCSVCGGWEGHFEFDEIEIVSIIEIPENSKKIKLMYYSED